MGVLDKILPGRSSKLSPEEEEEKRIRRYEVHIEKNGPYAPYDDDPNPKGRLRWYHWALHDMKSRVAYAIVFACVIGIAIPVILHLTINNNTEINNFGSCLVNPEFRFQCDINEAVNTLVNLSSCTNANGCWESNATYSLQAPRCYHSVPSMYQYYLQSNATVSPDRAQKRVLGPSDYIESLVRPVDNGDRSLLRFATRIYWCRKDVLSIEMFHETLSPEICPPWNDGGEEDGLVSGPEELIVDYSERAGDFFYFRVGRKTAEDETVFDTRLGPIRFYTDGVSISTALPTKYFYGLRGGQGPGLAGWDTVDGVTSFGQNELPFYMVREKSGKMHGLLLETSKPFVAQVIDGPAITFECQGDMRVDGSEFSMKLFVGPKVENVLAQLNAYLQAKNGRKFSMPPYWGLGLHLCRRTTNSSASFMDMQNLNREGPGNNVTTVEPIPYDSDCISENLRKPLRLNDISFPVQPSEINEIMDYLNTTSKKFLPTQRLSMSNVTVADMLTPENLQMFILNYNYSIPFLGIVGDDPVNYISIFNDLAQAWIKSEFEIPPGEDPVLSGLVLIDNFPLHEGANEEYINQTMVEYRSSTNSNSRIELQFSDKTWGNVPPRSTHMNVSSTGGTTLFHVDVSNIYGEESLKFFEDLAMTHDRRASNERIVTSTSSMWTDSYLYGAFNGLTVPFTWEGLRTSLFHTLRYFMFAPYSGIPVCGSYTNNESFPMDQELCLRWFQVGLLLPFVRNTYGDDNRNYSRGPLDLNLVYQRHLVNNIKDRYAYNPYYYTLFHDYTSTSIPPIVPLSFYFLDVDSVEETFQIYDQFMIGPAMMAAPLVFPGTSRSIYFPPGLWYDTEGTAVWNINKGGSTLLSALINHVPLFIRDGFTIPTLMKPTGYTAEESRAGTYTLVTTYPKPNVRTTPSTGSLYQDDGVSQDIQDEFNYVTFSTTVSDFTWTTQTCNLISPEISTVVDQVRIFGFPRRPTSIRNSATGEDLPSKSFTFLTENKLLRISTLQLDFCSQRNLNLTWSFT